MSKIIVNFTPTGMIPTKAMTPYVPVQASEIIEEVKNAIDLGITMVHLHARDEKGIPTYKKEIYAKIIRGIREYNKDIVIVVSTTGRTVNTFEARSEVLELEGNVKPDMASLTLGSINFVKDVSYNTPEMVLDLAKKMISNGIVPEFEVFDLGMVNYLNYVMKKFSIEAPIYVNFILGNISGAQTSLLHLTTLINELPKNTILSIGGIGHSQFHANQCAIALGYGVRIGLEDNIWYNQERTILATNLDLIKRIHRLIAANEHEMMSAVELRELLHLNRN